MRRVGLALCLLALEAAAGAAERMEQMGPIAPGLTGNGLTGNSSASGFLERYPALKDLVFKEETSPIRIGFGITPLSFMPGKLAIGISGLQIHWEAGPLDWEIFNASVDFSLGSKEHSSRHFIFRTVPKIRVLEGLSAGPLVGYEYVTFPDTLAQLAKAGFIGNPEPFSSGGLIFGAALTETFPWKEFSRVRITQSIYKQTYGIKAPSATEFGYRFVDPDIDNDADKAAIRSGIVFQLEIAVLF